MADLQTAASWYRGSYSNVYAGGVGYDGAPCVGRFAFTTDAAGAASLSFRTQRLAPDAQYNHDQPGTEWGFRWIVTEEPTGYERACGGGGWACEPGSGALRGSRALSLRPDTAYYLWIFPGSSAYCLWWIGGVSVSTEGSYLSPSGLEAADGCFGAALPITLSRSLADALHTVTVDCAGVHTVLLERSAQYPTVTWEPALADYAPLLPNAASAQALISVETFCRGQSLGTVSRTVTLRIPEGALEPALAPGWVTLQPWNQGAAAGFSCLIAGWSCLEAVFDPGRIDAAPLLGASITGYSLEAAGREADAAPYRSPVLRGPTEARVWLTDSRGQRHGAVFPVTPEPYAPPTLSGVRVFRCDAAGAADENGACIGFAATLEYSPLAGQNLCSLRASIRAPGGSFGPETDLSSGVLCVIGGQDPDRSCECRIRAVDGMGGETEALRRLPTRRWAMKFRPDGQGLAFGKAPERSKALELPGDWEIRVGQGSLWLALHPVGSLVLADTAPAEGTWADQGPVQSTRLWKRSA